MAGVLNELAVRSVLATLDLFVDNQRRVAAQERLASLLKRCATVIQHTNMMVE